MQHVDLIARLDREIKAGWSEGITQLLSDCREAFVTGPLLANVGRVEKRGASVSWNLDAATVSLLPNGTHSILFAASQLPEKMQSAEFAALLLASAPTSHSMTLKTAPEKDAERFQVVTGSQSVHCCFDFTVVDTARPIMVDGEHYCGQFEKMCECFEEEQAVQIAAALNVAQSSLQKGKA